MLSTAPDGKGRPVIGYVARLSRESARTLCHVCANAYRDTMYEPKIKPIYATRRTTALRCESCGAALPNTFNPSAR